MYIFSNRAISCNSISNSTSRWNDWDITSTRTAEVTQSAATTRNLMKMLGCEEEEWNGMQSCNTNRRTLLWFFVLIYNILLGDGQLLVTARWRANISWTSASSRKDLQPKHLVITIWWFTKVTVLTSVGLRMGSLPRVREKSSGPDSRLASVDSVHVEGWRMFPAPPRPVDC
jgi:hypothetical protein